MAGRGGGGFLVGLPVEVVMLLCSVQQAQRLGCLLFVPRLSASRICHLRDIYLDVSPVRSNKFSVVSCVVQPCHIECQRTQIETRTCTRTWWCYGG